MKIEMTNQDKLKFLSDLAGVLEKDGKDLYFAVRDDKQGTKYLNSVNLRLSGIQVQQLVSLQFLIVMEIIFAMNTI